MLTLNYLSTKLIQLFLTALFTLWLVTFTALIFHLITKGVDANISFGILY